MKKYFVETKEFTPCFFDETECNYSDLLVYHYRDFESFWNILKSESFWATNARFSNDEQEQKFGKDIIKKIYEDLGNEKPESINSNEYRLDENYIVCFSKENDALSQWRGYAPKGGVSMGFDLSAPTLFTILKSYADINSFKPSEAIEQYVKVADVCYIEPETKKGEGKYLEYCKDLLDINFNLLGDESNCIKEIEKKAPYIKHAGFKEEKECRLVFRGDSGELNECVRYKDNKQKTLKHPYVVVKAGGIIKYRECLVRVACSKKNYEILLIDALKKKGIKNIIDCQALDLVDKSYSDDTCRGCTLRKEFNVDNPFTCKYNDKDYYFLTKEVNDVVISQGEKQEETFEKVYDVVKEFNRKNSTNVKVWCEGHLPLRRITVGPCNNQEEAVEAIKHYCKHTYWLRDVEVDWSEIPFRLS